ncbi:hypothetical protein uav_169 [Pseudomonas phage UAVern]|uniref:Uncharacterized protein n=1 Tax=Pseudomonas phage UAVern TaxID=2856997 RepID=A0A975UY53_9CAUD|nr:hypothetical protein uav_169 [Pseudomonas phage UAVern]
MTVKTCVTCIYKKGSKCTKQELKPKIDLVTGQLRPQAFRYFSCETQRRFSFASCGAEGKWWKPIKSAQEKHHGPNIFQRAIISLLGVFR